MVIVNNAGIAPELVQRIANLAHISSRNLLIYLDDKINRSVREAAERNIEDYTQKNWKLLPWDLEKIETDKDHHAFFVIGSVIDVQAVPQYLKDATKGYDSLIYVDQIFLNSSSILTAATLAHECRHAWQYYELPLLYFSNLILSWVMEPHTTTAEQDAESFAKRTTVGIFGDEEVTSFVRDRISKGPVEETWMWQRFEKAGLNESHSLAKDTQDLLFRYAPQMRIEQNKLQFDIPMLETTASYLPFHVAHDFLSRAKRVK